jgi:translation initiation factor 3 subunit C
MGAVEEVADFQDPAAYTAGYESANATPTAAPVKKAKTQPGEQAETGDFMTIGKGGKALNLTSEGVFKTLKDILEQRGRKVGSPMAPHR